MKKFLAKRYIVFNVVTVNHTINAHQCLLIISKISEYHYSFRFFQYNRTKL